MSEGIARDEWTRRNALKSIERRQGPNGEWWALVVDGDGQYGVAMVSSDDPDHANGQRPDEAAPPPVDNGMLAPIRARLDELERRIGAYVVTAAEVEAATTKRLDEVDAVLGGHERAINLLKRKADGHG